MHALVSPSDLIGRGRRPVLVVAALALAMLIAAPAVAHAAVLSTLVSSPGAYPHAVSENKLLYSKDDGLYVCDLVLNNEKRISTDTAVWGASLDKGRAVWISYRNDTTPLLMYCDITAATPREEQIASDVADITSKCISGDRIIFGREDPDTYVSTLYVYQISTKQTKVLTGDSTSQYSASISGNRVVWTDEFDDSEGYTRDIRMLDLSTNVKSTLTTNTAQGHDHWWADIDGNRVVYQDMAREPVDGTVRIVALDLASMKSMLVSPNTYNGKVPKVSGNRAVWECDSGEMAGPDFATAIDAYDFTTGKVERLQDGGTTTILFDPQISVDRAVWYAGDEVSDRVMMAYWPPAPKVAKAAFSNPVAYELSSFLKTNFVVNTDKAGVAAKLTIKTASGTATLFNAAIPNAANVDYKLPAWDGKVAGKTLPSAAYDWTLTVTKDGASTVKTGKVTISKILFTVKGTSKAGVAVASQGYMVPGSANCYISAKTTAGADTMTVKLTGPAGFSVPSRYWSFGVATPLATTSYFNGTSAIKYRGLHTWSVTGKTNVTYSMTVIQ